MHRLAILVVCCFAAPSWASLLVYEPFNYTPGQPLTGQTNSGNGQTWVQAGPATRVNSIFTAAGNLNAPPELDPEVGNSLSVNGFGNTASNGTADRLGLGGAVLAPPTASDPAVTVYYSLTMKVTELTGSNNLNGGFSVGLNNSVGAQATSPTAAVARLQSRIDPIDPTKYNLGIFNNRSAVAASTSWSSLQLDVGATYFIVASYEMNNGPNNDLSRLYIFSEPYGALPTSAPGTATAIDNVFAPTELLQIASILMRQSPAPYVTLDELRVGTSWADVIPEPATACLFGISVLLLGSRRRQR